MSEQLLQKFGFHPVTEQWFQQTFDHPSPPQVQGWPSIASGTHTLILAPTGSGKTLAAFLWAIDELFRLGLETESEQFEQNAGGVHTLYISPLKALNNDINYNLKHPLQGLVKSAKLAGYEAPAIRLLIEPNWD